MKSEIVRGAPALNRSLNKHYWYAVVLAEWAKRGSRHEVLEVLISVYLKSNLREYLGSSLVEVFFLISRFPQTVTGRFLPQVALRKRCRGAYYGRDRNGAGFGVLRRESGRVN